MNKMNLNNYALVGVSVGQNKCRHLCYMLLIVGVTVEANAMVRIDVDLRNQRSGNRRSGKRRSASKITNKTKIMVLDISDI